jgi:two-component system NtrC family sensor kinase
MKILFHRLCMSVAILLTVLPLNAQKKSADEAYNKLVDIESNDTTSQQTIKDEKQLLPLAKADTTLLYIKEDLTSLTTYTHPDTAIIYAEQALQLAQKLNSITDLYLCYSALGEVLRILGEYPGAIEALLKSLRYCEKTGSKKELAFLYAEIGECYSDYGDYPKAQEALFKALSFVKKPMSNLDSARTAMFSIYLAEVYERKAQLDSALYFGNISYTLDSLINRVWSWPKIVLGDIYAKLNNKPAALGYYKNALHEGARKDSIDIYNGMAKVFLTNAKKDSAIYYASEAFSMAKSDSYLKEMLESATILANAYESNNKDSSIKFLRLSIAIKDTVFSQAKAREIQGFYFNDQMRQQEFKAVQQSYQNKIRLYILIGVIIIILSIAIVLLRNNRHKQKAFNRLQKQKAETDEQKQKAETTLNELKATQSQLIQSEKMASLGELTAGIAHEIQNPLNFVNNFSEVNKELIEELEGEWSKVNVERNQQLENELLKDIKENEEKINHHGKRADAIVKGMLQHSRISTGQKESTDINALADEYLRLSYHGLRAKDKNFNADFKTDFDESIGKINIVPQDIGRVLLNLYNNAFYAVNEKKKMNIDGYEPTVSIVTKKMNDVVELTVKDNGNGIPQNIVDKIFQPFFTTKPTGEGTGLGLSLSYDIIKAHGGQIKVESKEGEGTAFKIYLPVV